MNSLNLAERASYRCGHAAQMHADQSVRMDQARGAFVSTFDSKTMEASLLLAEVDFLDAADPRFAATVVTVEKDHVP